MRDVKSERFHSQLKAGKRPGPSTPNNSSASKTVRGLRTFILHEQGWTVRKKQVISYDLLRLLGISLTNKPLGKNVWIPKGWGQGAGGVSRGEETNQGVENSILPLSKPLQLSECWYTEMVYHSSIFTSISLFLLPSWFPLDFRKGKHISLGMWILSYYIWLLNYSP